ncbi:MAG: hypothetical protein WD181_06745 [Solirubrobacterales bacterium]
MSSLRTIDQTDLGITWVMDEPMARASHALVKEGQVWIIDPVDDPDAMAKVADLGEPVAVLQLLDRHYRDCQTVADRLGVPLVVLPDEVKSTPFKTISVVDNAIWKEKALWWQEKNCLVIPEALGSNRMYKPGPAGAGVHIGRRLTPPKRQLGTYLPEHLLFGHGESIHGPEATEALQQAIDRSVRDIPGAIIGLPKAFTSK